MLPYDCALHCPKWKRWSIFIFHGLTNCVNIHEMFKEKGPSIPFLLDGEFPLGHLASLARTAIPHEKNNQHAFKNIQLKKKNKTRIL